MCRPMLGWQGVQCWGGKVCNVGVGKVCNVWGGKVCNVGVASVCNVGVAVVLPPHSRVRQYNCRTNGIAKDCRKVCGKRS